MPLPIASRFNIQHAYRHVATQVKDKKTSSYFTITLSLFTLSFFGIFAIRPTLITAISLVQKVSELKSLNIAYEDKISNLLRAQMEYERIRDSLPAIDAAIPSHTVFPSFLKKMELVAEKYQIEIQQLQLDTVPIPKGDTDIGLKTYGFHLNAVGDYPSLLLYLQAITTWKRLLSVESFDMSAEGSTRSGMLRLNLKGSVYYLP